jgi:hypothetical protein
VGKTLFSIAPVADWVIGMKGVEAPILALRARSLIPQKRKGRNETKIVSLHVSFCGVLER